MTPKMHTHYSRQLFLTFQKQYLGINSILDYHIGTNKIFHFFREINFTKFS